MKLSNEPTMENIDDYNNQESPQKRRNVRLIILGLILFAGLLSYVKITNDKVSGYIGTPNNPGINVTPN